LSRRSSNVLNINRLQAVDAETENVAQTQVCGHRSSTAVSGWCTTADLSTSPVQDLLAALPERVKLPHPQFETLTGPSLYDRWLKSQSAAAK